MKTATLLFVLASAPVLSAPPASIEPAPFHSGMPSPDPAKHRDERHWAWQPLCNPQPPAVQNTAWIRNGIDSFILAELEKHGLQPAPRAEPRTLIRRAYFDLIGLPPPPEEVERFVQDPSPDAFAQVIENLLASPHYGERWARHWLDIARYGEDQAHSFQPRLYPQGFRYRDWLINAFNRDLPYDRFIMEQIAADLLGGEKEDLAALGFFATGPVYYGDKKMFDQWDDRVDTLTRGFLGLTVACARCHDHKFDPISTRDYYALAGVIASSEYVEAPLVSPEVVEAYDRAQTAIQDKQKEIDGQYASEAKRLAEDLLAQSATYLFAAWKSQSAPKKDRKAVVEELAKAEGLSPYVLNRWIRFLERTNRPPELKVWFELPQVPDLESGSSSASAEAEAEVRKAAGAVENYLLSLLRLKNALAEQRAAAEALSLQQEKSTEPETLAFLDQFIGKEGFLTLEKKELEEVLPPSFKENIARLRKELEDLKKAAPKKYPFVHALKESSEPRNLPVLVRGNPEDPGEEVPRRFLAVLSGDASSEFRSGSGRLELARAIADPSNPLTSRVMVNRIWQHHFGFGLVRSSSNFGQLGDRPSHPDLLDYLARRFIDSGWSMKSLHRLIMNSAAYQMAGCSDPRGKEIDPENRLLSRMNRKRLEVEAWRDAMLAVSGTLDRTTGGPSQDLFSPDNHRRTLYAKISRHELNPLLRLFDFPDPNVTSGTRTTTTVPLQQLFVLNSRFVVEQAKALAARIAASVPAEAGEPARIDAAYRLVFGRPPSAEESALGIEFLAAASEPAPPDAEPVPSTAGPVPPNAGSLTPWEQYAQALLGSNEFLYID